YCWSSGSRNGSRRRGGLPGKTEEAAVTMGFGAVSLGRGTGGGQLGDLDRHELVDFTRARQFDEHRAVFDADREGADAERVSAQARTALEREGLLVLRAGDLRHALLVAEQAAREHHVAHVRTHVLRRVPFAARAEVVDGDLRVAVANRHAAVEGEVLD